MILITAGVATAQYSQKLSLDGDLDYATTPDTSGISITGNAMTVEMWIKHEGHSDENAFLINKSQNNGAGYYLQLKGSGEEVPVKFWHKGNRSWSITSNEGIPAGRWTHVAAVLGGGTLSLYINGHLDHQVSDDHGMWDNDRPLRLGTNSSANGNFYSGDMDNVRIWNKARSYAEIRNNRFEEMSGTESGLVANYSFYQGAAGNDRASFHDLKLVDNASASAPDALPVPPDAYVANEGNGQIKVHWDMRADANSANPVGKVSVYKSPPTGFTNRTKVDTYNASTIYANGGTGSGTYSASNDKTYFWQVSADTAGLELEPHKGDFSSAAPGTPYVSQGGGSLELDGDLDYATVSDRPSLSLKGQEKDSITVEAWIKYDRDSDPDAYILDKLDSNNNGYELRLVGSGGEVPVRYKQGANRTTTITSKSGIPADTWTHIAVSFDGSTLSLYINGQLDNKVSDVHGIWDGDTPLQIGTNSTANDRFFKGHIDEVAIWGTARTQKQIQSSYQTELIGNEWGLKGYWRFNDTGKQAMTGRAIGETYRHADAVLKDDAKLSSPGIFPVPPSVYAKAGDQSADMEWQARRPSEADQFGLYRAESIDGKNRTSLSTVSTTTNAYTDNSAQNNTNYFYEGTVFNVQGQESDYAHPAPVTPSPYAMGRALTLDGNNDYGTVSDRPSLSFVGPQDSVTVEAWVKYDSTSNKDAYIFSKRAGSGVGYRLRVVGKGAEVPVRFKVKANFSSAIESNTKIKAGIWTHIAVSYDHQTMSMYINGKQDKVASRDKGIWDSEAPLQFGANSPGNDNFFRGMIDEVRIWSSARTKTEIADNYDHEIMGNEPELLGYWRFNEVPGTPKSRAAAERPKVVKLFGDANLFSHPVSDLPPIFLTEKDTVRVKEGESKTVQMEARARAHAAYVQYYSLDQAPAFASIDSTSGMLTLAPAKGKAGNYDFKLQATDDGGRVGSKSLTVVVEKTTAVPGDRAIPNTFALGNNYPNPFNPTTTIKYQLPKAAHVTLSVYNSLGRRVATLVDKQQDAGSRRVTFEANSLPSGIYFYRIQAGSFQKVRSMTLIK